MKLYPHQAEALKRTEGLNRVAFFHDMGLGKTFTGAEKMYQLNADNNLVICQKSKINDWINHLSTFYSWNVYDGTKKKQLETGLTDENQSVIVINYELAFRRAEIADLSGFTLLLDESSMIQNETAKRSKFILKLKPDNVILLSGSPAGGKYEKLWSQCRLLGWDISKRLFWGQFIITRPMDVAPGQTIQIVTGYKNTDRLKRKLREHGAQFLKTEEVMDLPSQTFQRISVDATADYKRFRKDHIITIMDDSDSRELVGDTTLTRLLYERQLCGQYNAEKFQAVKDLLESSDERFVIFYNFNVELNRLIDVVTASGRKYSLVNGSTKDLTNYEAFSDSVTLVQYQAGSMGLNLQKARRIIYFTPPLSSELYEQSKKRIHRIGQEQPCFYYNLVCQFSVEDHIYIALDQRRDYTEELFKEGEITIE